MKKKYSSKHFLISILNESNVISKDVGVNTEILFTYCDENIDFKLDECLRACGCGHKTRR